MLLTPEIVPGLVATGASARAHVEVAPKFKVGDRIRVVNINPTTHTRLPGYLRGKLGVVEFDYGVFEFPDTHAHAHEGVAERPQHCYRVRFTAREVWGPTANPVDSLRVDVFDDYLQPA
jgi:nitrile hydratase